MVKEFTETKKLHVASLHIINPPPFRYATLILLLASTQNNQSQEIKSRNIIGKEEEKQDENLNHSKRRVEIKMESRSL